MKWPIPTFESTDADGDFRHVSQAIAWNQSFESEAIAPKKKRAEQLTDREVFKQLQAVEKG